MSTARKDVLMECGHVAQTSWGDKPACVICFPSLASRTEARDVPSLEGRTAICTCSKPPVPSSLGLAFFEYRGPGSKAAAMACRHCGYYEVAHGPDEKGRPPSPRVCGNFEPHGGWEHDLYYCGHAGWD